jgi:prepilin-type N-terminal cleavage/methylation domain-containing protein
MPTRMPNSRRKPNDRSDSGFSLLEVVVATLILTVGLLAVASSIGYAVVAGNHGRAITNTKLLVVSILEQMETMRNTGALTFGQIANVGDVNNLGVFQTGFQQISTNPGPDGIFGTADDLIDAGPDAIYGNGDDFVNPNLAVIGYTREIQITSLSPTLKKIQVTVKYPVNGQLKLLVASGYLTNTQ